MSSLLSLQDAMTSAILGGDMAHVADQFLAGEADPVRRLGIFRNNTLISLTECLKTVFPVTVKLSDPRFFAFAAHEFITNRPPREARLSCYGEGFPKFLASFAPCRQFPVIAEMAALEWAISESLNEGEEPPIPIALASPALRAGEGAGFRLQPNLRFAVSRWPLFGVWADHKKENVVITAPLRPRISRVAIMTHGDDLQCLEIDAARFAFWRSLARGKTLEVATAMALHRDPLFDLVKETMLLFRSGLVTGIVTPHHKDI